MQGYKTILYSVVVLLLSVFDLLINDGGMLTVLFRSPERAMVALTVLKIITVVLRFMTTTPVFSAAEPPPEPDAQSEPQAFMRAGAERAAERAWPK